MTAHIAEELRSQLDLSTFFVVLLVLVGLQLKIVVEISSRKCFVGWFW